MQHIQDKDFDQRLKDQFEDGELPIPTEGWTRLENALYPAVVQKNRKGWWIAAASIFIVGTIGLYLNSDSLKQDRQLVAVSPSKQHSELSSATARLSGTEALNRPGNASEPTTELIGNKKQDVKAVVQTKLNRATTLTQKITKEASVIDPPNEKKILTALQPSLALARPDQKRQLVGPEKLRPFSEQETPFAGLQDDEDSEPQSGIRNIGDLVNYVVDKMDKRTEKILKFKTEDDNSSLIAINIGLLKFNPKKR